ncbi:three-Cys-motif partner protein TcmP [Allosphingosinicella indica]|uniref:Three-Cys-motif partner protein n=1 Tax=Allosphingosinicella indica TaxID=941907 RepID=A0A1X7FZQ1_9SPHN|nr:three-Cys-motif partner protein TcmP [Allosphingosinicella indica]SMF61582.1 three-Cys-motif partner protein [Allosphingosinicella indica]
MAVAAEQGHRFGGAWTEVKLDAVSYYCQFFNKVLVGKPTPSRPFERWYFDAFAGSGTRQVDRESGGLLEGRPIEIATQDMAGSVLNALNVEPPFHKLAFIEGHRGRFKSLEKIRAAHPERGIVCLNGDANKKLVEIFSAPPWSDQREGRGSCRGLCFLDPYGMNVNWATLKLLAQTRAIDVWYLFPLDAVSRQLAARLDRVDTHKQRRLDEIFGTPTWREDIYKVETTNDLFAERITTATRQFDRGQIERYAQERLQTIFSAYVSNPLPLLNDSGRQLFSLFCLSNSVSEAAIALIKRGVAGVLKKYGGQ